MTNNPTENKEILTQITLSIEDFEKFMVLTESIIKIKEITQYLFNLCKDTNRLETWRIQELLIDLRVALGE